MNDAKRPSVYLPPEIHAEILEQAEKYGISTSKCIQDAWRIARLYRGPFPDGVSLFRDGPPVSPETPEDNGEGFGGMRI
jgi:hypothetical protein